MPNGIHSRNIRMRCGQGQSKARKNLPVIRPSVQPCSLCLCLCICLCASGHLGVCEPVCPSCVPGLAQQNLRHDQTAKIDDPAGR
eukprot:331620-Rhodomonas_salina.1